MRRSIRQCVYLLAFAPLAITATGCLSLGGKNTYYSEKPETLARIDSLEARVGVMERALAPSAPTVHSVPTPQPAQVIVE